MAITDNNLRSTRFAQKPAGDFVTNKQVSENIVADFKRLVTEINTIVGSDITGGGTQNYIPKWDTAAGDNIGNSLLFDNGTTIQMGGTGALPSALFALTSTTQGFLAPRMTTAQRDAIAAPATGLWIYNTTTSLFNYYDGTWQTVDSSTTADTLAQVLASGNDTGGSTIIYNAGLLGIATFNIQPISWTVNSSNPAFAGLEYSSDFSANYSARSLVDKGYTDSLWTKSGTNIYNGNSGNVGIGTVNPTQKLQVGERTSGASATPDAISIGSSFGNSVANSMKLWVYDDAGGTRMGLGVSSGQFNYFGGGTSFAHTFYHSTGATSPLAIFDGGGWNTFGSASISNGTRLLIQGSGVTSATFTAKFSSSTTEYFFLRDDKRIVYTDGNEASGKVLTSDANGVGTWESVSSTSTFTPTVTLVGGAGNVVPVYSTNTGRYTKIGNTIFVDIWLTGDGGAEGAGTGQVNIALPFTSSASHPDGRAIAGVAINGSSEVDIYGTIAGATSTITLWSRAVVSILGTNVQTADIAAWPGSGQSSTTRSIRLKFFYEI